MKGRDNMKHNKVFKEEEVRIIEVAGRPYISMDDWDRILSDLFFTKCDLETHTLRVIKRLGASIALSYKALRDNQQLDLNEELAIVPLSKKKIQDLSQRHFNQCLVITQILARLKEILRLNLNLRDLQRQKKVQQLKIKITLILVIHQKMIQRKQLQTLVSLKDRMHLAKFVDFKKIIHVILIKYYILVI